MKYIRFIFLAFYLFIIFLIFHLSLASGEESTQTSNKATEIAIEVYDTITPTKESVTERHSMDEIKIFIRKAIGHFSLFAALGLFASLTYIFFIKKRLILLILSFSSGFIIAALSELCQMIAENRGPAFSDVLLDYSGYLLSTFIVLLITYLILKRKKVSHD